MPLRVLNIHVEERIRWMTVRFTVISFNGESIVRFFFRSNSYTVFILEHDMLYGIMEEKWCHFLSWKKAVSKKKDLIEVLTLNLSLTEKGCEWIF